MTADGDAAISLAVVLAGRPGGRAASTGAPLPTLVRRTLDEATADGLAADLAAGADGVVATGLAAADDVERLAARLAVAEALSDRPEGSAAIVVLVDTAALVAALPARPLPRMTGLGIDAAAVAETMGLPEPAGVAIDTARGLVVLAAAAARVPAFERLEAAPGPIRLDAARTDGFAWVMTPLVDP